MSGRTISTLWKPGLAALAIFAGLRACGVFGPTLSYNSRMTVTVAAPWDEASGDSVIACKV